jgi:hypothetical protein
MPLLPHQRRAPKNLEEMSQFGRLRPYSLLCNKSQFDTALTKILNRGAVVKGYEYEKDRYVAIEKEELKSIEPKTATRCRSRHSSS